MSRAKLFLENLFVYGCINILSKIIPFLLLPIITRMLSKPSDYGVYDMYNTIVGFGSPLAMLGIYDAMFREYFEKEDQQYKYNVTTTASRIVLVSSLIIGAILIVFSKFFSKLIYGTNIYGYIVIFSGIELLITNNSTIISAPTRINNNRKIYVSSGILNSLIYYVLAIVFIYIGFSYYGMIFANIISSTLLLIFFWKLNKEFFKLGKFDKKIAKELFKIGVPLVPTFLIYWIYNSMDKVMITNMLGTGELGVYSIGARVASLSSLIYYAFAGGWQYFSFSTMKDDDQVLLNSKVFEYLGLISYLSLFMVYPFIKPLFAIMFPNSYIGGAEVVPYLYLSPLLLMLFQIAGNQFLIIKKSYMSTMTLSIGAIINVILNYLLIKPYGIEGAAIATLVGYMISVCIVCISTSHLKLMKISKRFLAVSCVLIIYLFISRILFLNNILYLAISSVVNIVLCLLLYKSEIKVLYYKLKNLINKKTVDRRG